MFNCPVSGRSLLNGAVITPYGDIFDSLFMQEWFENGSGRPMVCPLTKKHLMDGYGRPLHGYLYRPVQGTIKKILDEVTTAEKTADDELEQLILEKDSAENTAKIKDVIATYQTKVMRQLQIFVKECELEKSLRSKLRIHFQPSNLFICHISQEPLEEPVIAIWGTLFNRGSIEKSMQDDKEKTGFSTTQQHQLLALPPRMLLIINAANELYGQMANDIDQLTLENAESTVKRLQEKQQEIEALAAKIQPELKILKELLSQCQLSTSFSYDISGELALHPLIGTIDTSPDKDSKAPPSYVIELIAEVKQRYETILNKVINFSGDNLVILKKEIEEYKTFIEEKSKQFEEMRDLERTRTKLKSKFEFYMESYGFIPDTNAFVFLRENHLCFNSGAEKKRANAPHELVEGMQRLAENKKIILEALEKMTPQNKDKVLALTKRFEKQLENMRCLQNQILGNTQNWLKDKFMLDKNRPDHLQYWQNDNTFYYNPNKKTIVCNGTPYRIPMRIAYIMEVVDRQYAHILIFITAFNEARCKPCEGEFSSSLMASNKTKAFYELSQNDIFSTPSLNPTLISRPPSPLPGPG